MPTLDIVDGFQYSESVANANDTHLFQLLVPQCYQRFTDYLVLCRMFH